MTTNSGKGKLVCDGVEAAVSYVLHAREEGSVDVSRMGGPTTVPGMKILRANLQFEDVRTERAILNLRKECTLVLENGREVRGKYHGSLHGGLFIGTA